jgi:hypothetical protein
MHQVVASGSIWTLETNFVAAKKQSGFGPLGVESQ